MPRLNINSETIAELRKLALMHADARYRLRCQILIRSTQVDTIREVAHQLGTNSSAVRATRRRFAESGIDGLADRRAKNGRHRRRVTADYRKVVAGLLTQSPEDHGLRATRWTRFLLVHVAAQRTGIVVSPSTVIRVVQRIVDDVAVRAPAEVRIA